MHHRKYYCNILGLSENASLDEIKKAYFNLSNLYHPDRNKDPKAVKKFEEISDAYEALKNNKFLTNNYENNNLDKGKIIEDDYDNLEDDYDNSESYGEEDDDGDTLLLDILKSIFKRKKKNGEPDQKNKEKKNIWKDWLTYVYLVLLSGALFTIIGVMISKFLL